MSRNVEKCREMSKNVEKCREMSSFVKFWHFKKLKLCCKIAYRWYFRFIVVVIKWIHVHSVSMSRLITVITIMFQADSRVINKRSDFPSGSLVWSGLSEDTYKFTPVILFVCYPLLLFWVLKIKNKNNFKFNFKFNLKF